MNWFWKAVKYIDTRLYYYIKGMPDDSFWFKNYLVDIEQYYPGGATKENSKLKVVQLSDLHLRCIGPGLKKAIAKVNAMKPELIVITGDSINGNKYLPLLDTLLKLFDRDIKKVAILGNWEYSERVNISELRAVYAQNNCDLLINENKQYAFDGKTICITGVDDFTHGKADFTTAVNGLKESDYHIVLTHCPEHRDVIKQEMSEDMKIDFVLSGHTHGGQINMFGWVPFRPLGSGKYLKEWYTSSFPILYVSKGIGTSIFPIRFRANAEIAVFNLKA